MPIQRKAFPRPMIVLVGKTNVGKSTLFNRISGSARALVSPIPATTRDVLTTTIEWQGRKGTLVDTGGLHAPPKQGAQSEQRFRNEPRDPFHAEVREKVLAMIRTADHCCLVVDGTAPMTTHDEDWVRFLRTTQKPITLIVNKLDNPRLRQQATDWYALGIEELYLVSASNGSGIGDLLDHLLSRARSTTEAQTAPPADVLIVGKPNVGKSSLFNAVLGENASIVSPIAHTTREPHSRQLSIDAVDLSLTDSVGIRRKKREQKNLEFTGAQRTLARLRNAGLAILVVDPFIELLTQQDQRLGQAIADARSAAIIVVNKIDAKAPTATIKRIEVVIRRMFPHLSYAPVMFTSSTQRIGISQLAQRIIEVYTNYTRTFTSEELHAALEGMILFPKQLRKKSPAAVELEQVSTRPPEFLIRRWKSQKTPIAIIDLIVKHLRNHLPLLGTPITVHVEKIRKTIPNRKRRSV